MVGTPGRLAAPELRLGRDHLAIAASATLNQAVAQPPEVRSKKVSEAKALIQDAAYPPDVIIREISAMLAVRIDSRGASG